MNKEQKIEYQILKYVESVHNTKEDDIVDDVYKKFIISNFFRINRIYRIDIYHCLLKLIERKEIIGGVKEK